MKAAINGFFYFLKTTILGGVTFLLPFGAAVLLAREANKQMQKVAKPLSKFVPIENFAGLATATIISLLLLLIICFLAGIIAKSVIAEKFVEKVESNILSLIPGYVFAREQLQKNFSKRAEKAQQTGSPKSATNSMVEASNIRVINGADLSHFVLVHYVGIVRFGFVMETLTEGRCIVFFPSAPEFSSGYLEIVQIAQIERAPLEGVDVEHFFKNLGRGYPG